MNTKYKYIYPPIDVYNSTIDVEQALIAAGAEVNGSHLYCPNGHSKRQKISIYRSGEVAICKCHNCGAVKGAAVDVAKWYKGGNFVEAIKWLSETFQIEKVLNPDYVSPSGETISDEELRKAREKLQKIQPKAIEVVNAQKSIEYLAFNKDLKYNFIKELNAFMPNGEYWGTFDSVQKLRVIYTWFFNKSFELGSNKAKYAYYKNRGIDVQNNWLKRIGYLAVEDFDSVLKDALSIFPLDSLVLVGLIKEDGESNEKRLSFDYVKKGGVLLVPSFDLYSNTVTGFMLRPTHPEQWMKDRHMKEIQLSNTSIVYPLPFGLTFSSLKNHNEFYVTEGHPDALALPGNVENEPSKAFFSLPGVNGLSEAHLGLLKGKKIILCFDQDEAGKKAAFGYSTLEHEGKKEFFIDGRDDLSKKVKVLSLQNDNKKFTESFYEGLSKKLERAGISYEVKEWDIRLGSDINDVRINGNIGKIF